MRSLNRPARTPPKTRIDWDTIAERYVSVNEDRSRIVYPRMLEILRACRVRRVFDFGGGDGRFIEALLSAAVDWESKPEALICYDPSAEMRELARRRLRHSSTTQVIDRSDEAWRGRYDAVTFNAVWMGLEDEDTCTRTLRLAASLIRPGAIFLASVTHPCFRDRVFHSYSTDFDMRQYFENGSGFAVHIYDSANAVEVLDTHWNLEAMTRQLMSAGLLLRRIHELPDVDAAAAGSPWMLLEAVVDSGAT